MNLFTALNDAMRIAMETDDSAVVFGEVFKVVIIFIPVIVI